MSVQRDNAFGYIIMENQNESYAIENLDVVNNPNLQLFFVRFDTVLQSLDCENRNRRWYAKDGMISALKSPSITELIERGTWCGEYGHPIDSNLSRISVIDPKLTSHKITKWWIDGNLIKGTIETLDDGMYGTKFTKSIIQKGEPAFSLRALARLTKKGNITYVNTPPHIITYDGVILPSHKEAYADKSTNKKVSKSFIDDKEFIYEGTSAIKMVSSTTGEKFVYENGSIAITANDLKGYIINKSDNLKIVCESFDIDPKNISLMDGGRTLGIKQNDGNTYVFALEQQLMRETINYLGSL